VAHTFRLSGAKRLLFFALISTVAVFAFAQTHQPSTSHSDPVTAIVLALAVISSFLVAVFFVLMGMRLDLAVFANLDVLGLAALLTAAAIVGNGALTFHPWRCRQKYTGRLFASLQPS
jgi:hypothetical protein